MQIQEQKDTALGSFGRLWKRRKWLALSVFALAFAAAAGFIAALPNIYSATATVLVNPLAGSQDTGPGPGQNQDSRLDSVSEAVLTRSRLLDLVQRFDLYPELRKRTSTEGLLTRLRQDITVDRKSGPQQWGQDPTFAFTLSYQGWDPQKVAVVANALATSYVNENNAMRSQQAAATLASLQAQLADIKKKLDSQQQKINSFRSGHLGELPEQETASLAMLQQLDTQLHENNEAMAQAVQQQRQALPDRTAADAGTDGADLALLEQQLAGLRTRYTDQYPDVIRLKAQIAALKRDRGLQSTGDGATASPAGDSFSGTFQSYQDEDRRLRAEIQSYQSRLESMPVREQQLQSLMQGYAETEDVYSQLLKRYEEVPLPDAPGGQYRVLENAVPPTDPAGPDRLRLLLVSLVLSMGLAAVVVFLMEQLDPSFHSIDELRAFSRVPVLANIPQIVTPRDVWRSRLRFGTAALSIVVAIFLLAQVFSFMGRGNEGLVWMLSHHGTPGATTSTSTSTNS